MVYVVDCAMFFFIFTNETVLFLWNFESQASKALYLALFRSCNLQ